MSRIKQSGFQRHFPYQNVLQNLRVRKWLENSQLFRTCENTAQELAENIFPQVENWQRKTLQWPRRQWERAGRLMWFWADKQPLWKTCYMELPSHSPFPGTVLQTQAAPSLDPQASKQLSEWKRKNLRDPKHSFFSRKGPQQCPPQNPPTQTRRYCCNSIASNFSDSWRVIQQKTHSHKQL